MKRKTVGGKVPKVRRRSIRRSRSLLERDDAKRMAMSLVSGTPTPPGKLLPVNRCRPGTRFYLQGMSRVTGVVLCVTDCSTRVWYESGQDCRISSDTIVRTLEPICESLDYELVKAFEDWVKEKVSRWWKVLIFGYCESEADEKRMGRVPGIITSDRKDADKPWAGPSRRIITIGVRGLKKDFDAMASRIAYQVCRIWIFWWDPNEKHKVRAARRAMEHLGMGDFREN